MEHTLCFPHFRASSPNKPFTDDTRSKWRRTSSLAPTAAEISSATLMSPPSSLTLNDPIYTKSLSSVRQVHARILKTTDLWLSESTMDSLIQIYSDLGDFRSAAMVFFVALQFGTLSWSHLTNTFGSRDGNICRLLEIFQQLHRIGTTVFSIGIVSRALKECAEVVDFWLGFQIHAYLTKVGMENESYIRCSLMDFYAHCCSLESSDKLFEDSSHQDSILWNKFIVLNVENGRLSEALELFQKMQFWGLELDEVTVSKVLHACGRLEAVKEGKAIHGYVIRSGRFPSALVSNSLISMYSKNFLVNLARRVFEYMGGRTLVSWNSIISCCSLNGYLEEAMELFYDMVASGVKPDLVTWNCLISGYSHHGSPHHTFGFLRRMQNENLRPNSSSITSVLRSIAASGLVELGKEIHGYAIRHGHDRNVFVGTSLTDMYLKCYNLANARSVFDKMPHRNVLTWNSIIAGYAHEGLFDEALELLKQMEEGVEPDITTWNGLISGYSIHGLSSQAVVLIRQMKANGVEPNVISWTAVISGCCRRGQYDDALYYFREMQNEGVQPNSVTIATLLRACASQALLGKGRELHCLATRKALNGDIYVATALIDMYSKSGSLTKAHLVFKLLEHKNLASWNAMIMGFGAHGQGKEAISLFNQMSAAGIKSDGITFTALLSGCRHSGLVDDGWNYFDSMNKYNVTPSLEHYTCMVDLLARCGYLDEAWDFMQNMPFEPDASIWGSLLSACRTHKNVELAEMVATRLFQLEPYNSANYLLMMSIYASANRWEDAKNVRDAMNAAGVKSWAGWSWVEIDQTVHVFEIEGRPHPEIGKIYFELSQLVSEMRRVGYVPDTSCIVYNVGEEEKEKMLLTHTEKLAITYGLISTGSGTPIRVIKNTRVCNDCHMVAKYMSEITGREILVRDGVRFHHFMDGRCSCNDFW
ncbi:pentatricopeptide repeat-containing protein [Canna indica]|uniref:Pentatricopeptide repeat-containing protein n=1 Tax=Canna indica TaxID=4628 RepID=A0AAQ3JKC7_9LILI|nr:pentatricopeptide repeat-containing protein [Canna indica]